jgi:eukaryotic-like serine/threonine-protein kinase
MSQSPANLADTEASLMWEQLSVCIDAVVDAWQGAESPPDLAVHLPDGPAALRRLALVEAIKVDLEYRWQARRWPKLIEDYLREFPELSHDGGVPCDVIYEEYHIRKQRGEQVTIDEYCQRFPTRVAELRRLFELEAPEQTVALVGAERSPNFQAGEKIDDFDLIKSLGKGAFATVFLARQCSMQRLVALKISRDRGFEPQTLAQLDHPHIVRVFDQRQLATSKLRLLYMQYIAGGTLQGVVEHVRQIPPAVRSGAALIDAIDRALVNNGEQPPTDSMTRYRLARSTWPEVVCWLGARLAGALAYAHQRGVLHRDVKPANVLVGADGHPKLADFNISFSKLDGATPAAYFGGSLAYMSPEQLEACDPAHSRQPEDLDGRSDVYSLGVLLWELLTGRRPFPEDALPAGWGQALSQMAAIRRQGIPPKALEMIPTDCPPGLIDVLRKCLAADVDERYASADELARELDLCLQPRAHALLHPQRSWRSIVKRYPVASTIAIGLLPNMIMSVVNVVYNWAEIVGVLGDEDQRVFFHAQIAIINGMAYTIGLGYVFYTRGRLFRTLARLARGQRVEPPPSREMVRRCLTFGAAVAVITALLWTLSGFIFPTWMQLSAGPTSQLSARHYTHFIVSNLLCGMIAATQSYFIVTFLSVRYCYPWLLAAHAADARDVGDLAEVARRGRIVLALTLSIPFVALAALVLVAFQRPVIGGLGGLGLISCAIGYLLDVTIRGDLAALAAVISPGGDVLLASDSIEAALSGSRR